MTKGAATRRFQISTAIEPYSVCRPNGSILNRRPKDAPEGKSAVRSRIPTEVSAFDAVLPKTVHFGALNLFPSECCKSRLYRHLDKMVFGTCCVIRHKGCSVRNSGIHFSPHPWHSTYVVFFPAMPSLNKTATLDRKRLLELFPVTIIRSTWSEIKGSKSDICSSVAESRKPEDLLKFVAHNLSVCKQHVFVFERSDKTVLPKELLGTEGYFPDAETGIYIIRTTFTTLLREPAEETWCSSFLGSVFAFSSG